MKYLAAVVASGCAMTSSTCPVGSTLRVAKPAGGRVEWCTAADPTLTSMPEPGHTFAAAIGNAAVDIAPGGTHGPYTAWYPGGKLRAHGSYRDEGDHSVADGLWVFWRPDGMRAFAGHYHRGTPVGCFAVWDEQNVEHTGMAEGEQLHEQPCAPPSELELATIEGHVPTSEPRTAWADAAVGVLGGPNTVGATSSDQDVEHRMTYVVRVTARARIGRWRVGPTLGYGIGDEASDAAVSAGIAAAWALPLSPRLEMEVGGELGVVHVAVDPLRQGREADALSFWAPLPAVQGTLALALSPVLSAVFGVRIDGAPTRNESRDSLYLPNSTGPITETWQVGGFSYGATIGVRVLAR